MKLLYITSLSGRRINGFMRSAIVAARDLNIDVVMACNTDGADKKGYEEDCMAYEISVAHIDFNRNPLSRSNWRAKKQLQDLIIREAPDIIHCNTPIGGLLGRLCAQKLKIPNTIYQAHGFHFWKGAPIKDWILYYPIERILARFTDILITINQEDYKIAQKFKLKERGAVKLVHGVGVDTEVFKKNDCSDKNIRDELGIPSNAIVYTAVGELNKNKNQGTIIKSFINANIEGSYLLLCGDGDSREKLERIVHESGKRNIFILGFRRDVSNILNESNVFIHASYREGLPGALMEAMSVGLPCIASRIRGNIDLVGEEYKYLFDPHNEKQLTEKMQSICNEQNKYGNLCKKAIQKYEFGRVVNELKEIYKKMMDNDRFGQYG